MVFNNPKEVLHLRVLGRYREAVPQVLASIAKNLLLLNFGASFAFIMVALFALKDAKETFTLTAEQISWLAGSLSMSQPIGSALSGVMVEYLGRKRPMMFLNIPCIGAWLLFTWAQSAAAIFTATIIIGICFGLSEAPAKTYAGEICQPNLRGSLTAFSGVFLNLGILLEFLLATVMNWRTIAAVNIVVPAITIICIAMIPDSPIWLVSKGRIQQAEAALCWLRGWVSPSAVSEELRQLIQYNERSKTNKSTFDNPTDSGCLSILKALLMRETLLPLGLVLTFFVIEHLGVGSGLQMYVVEVYTELQLPMGPYWTKITIKMLGITMTLVLTFVVPRLGKRRMTLVSIVGLASCHLLIGSYAHMRLVSPWVAQVLVIATYSFGELGIVPIPWMLISEIFPFRTRGVVSGLAAAISHLMFFVCAKTFHQLRGAIGLGGVYWLYTCVSVFGIVFIYWCLPETEGKTQEEIEELFCPKRTSDKGSPEELLELRVGAEECLPKTTDTSGFSESRVVKTNSSCNFLLKYVVNDN